MGSTSRHLDWSALAGFFPQFPASERWLDTLQRHSALVKEWNDRAGLTSVPEHETVFRNYAESLEIWSLAVCEGVEAAGDLGSGGGFPGVVGAAVSPAVEMHLIETHRRRARFLELSCEVLALRNLAVHELRAEEAGRGELREHLDRVVARAIAPLPTLLEYAAPLLRLGGMAVLAKGSAARREVKLAEAVCIRVGLEFGGIVDLRPEVSATPYAVCYRKIAATPDEFPRRPGVPRRRPLR